MRAAMGCAARHRQAGGQGAAERAPLGQQWSLRRCCRGLRCTAAVRCNTQPTRDHMHTVARRQLHKQAAGGGSPLCSAAAHLGWCSRWSQLRSKRYCDARVVLNRALSSSRMSAPILAAKRNYDILQTPKLGRQPARTLRPGPARTRTPTRSSSRYAGRPAHIQPCIGYGRSGPLRQAECAACLLPPPPPAAGAAACCRRLLLVLLCGPCFATAC